MSLLIVIVIMFAALRIRGASVYDAAVRGLAVGMACSGVEHIVNREWYVSVMPSTLSDRMLIVQISAALRLLLGALLFFRPAQHACLLSALILMCVVSPVNIRIAISGAEMAGAQHMSAVWRWFRLGLHVGWIGWIIACLVMLGRVLRVEAEEKQAKANDQTLVSDNV